MLLQWTMVQKVCLELKLLSCCSGEINFIFCARLPKYGKFQSKRQNWGLILNFKQRRCRRRQTILWGFKVWHKRLKGNVKCFGHFIEHFTQSLVLQKTIWHHFLKNSRKQHFSSSLQLWQHTKDGCWRKLHSKLFIN